MAIDKLYYRRNQDGTLFIIINREGIASLSQITGMPTLAAKRFQEDPFLWRINDYWEPKGLGIFKKMDETTWIEIPEGMTIDMERLSISPRIRIHDCFIPIK